MLFNLEPDQSITGGSWYSNQEFESEFVDVLNQQCFKFLQQKVEKNNQPTQYITIVMLCMYVVRQQNKRNLQMILWYIKMPHMVHLKRFQIT